MRQADSFAGGQNRLLAANLLWYPSAWGIATEEMTTIDEPEDFFFRLVGAFTERYSMQDQFKLFYKKSRRDLIIKSIIIGLSAAALAIGGLLLMTKILRLDSVICLIGVSALPIGFALSYLLHRRSIRRLALRMDGDFGLHEKVQTMIAFEKSDDSMVRIQREDTERILGEITSKKLKFQNIWLYALLPVMTLAILGAAIAFPKKADAPVDPNPGEKEPIREITEWEWKALDELILYVQNSEADAEVLKPKTVTSLMSLRDLLKEREVSQSSLQNFANVTMNEIENARIEAENLENITDAQKSINREVTNYVVAKLCEIFGLNPPQIIEDDDPASDNNNNPDTPSHGSDVSMGADDRIYNTDKGYVKYQDVISGYYRELDEAFHDGVLSEDDWYDFMMSYFRYLYGTDSEQ